MKGTISEPCTECSEIDDEQHRLAVCKKWSNLNGNHNTHIHFRDIYSENIDVLDRVLPEINMVWEMRFANGRMKKQ